jgi:hypothetical protein
VPPGSLAGNGPVILAGVTRTQPAETLFGARKPEIVPGSDDPRRVLRLACDITIEIRPATPNQGRRQQMQGLEQILYLLDAPELRSGQALASGAPADPGFFIQSLAAGEGLVALEPAANDAEPVTVAARAEGWFWPIGVAGQTGIPIGEIRLRGAALPLSITPSTPVLIAGGGPVDLVVVVGAGSFGTFDLPANPALPFGALAFSVVDAGGRPGKGALVGAVGGVRMVAVADNSATVQYQPPAEAASDVLVISLDDGEGGAGIEIARAPLNVRGA